MSETGDGERISGEMDPARVLESRIRDLENELEEDRLKRDGVKAAEEGWWLDRLLSVFRKKQPTAPAEPEDPPFSDEERAEKETLLKELRAQAKISQVTKGMSGSN